MIWIFCCNHDHEHDHDHDHELPVKNSSARDGEGHHDDEVGEESEGAEDEVRPLPEPGLDHLNTGLGLHGAVDRHVHYGVEVVLYCTVLYCTVGRARGMHTGTSHRQ